ncbi:hypothetical protein A3841_00850 [Pontibacter flavimaris]|uniref:Phage tail tape measure protein n=2 Tax=Pontibacter flavimaris TaxID=1797110 RepID=A0A1Q5PBG6_9BACT|nr:hypothetical protein A3841_00850 [Pontibacter flavimaris]
MEQVRFEIKVVDHGSGPLKKFATNAEKHVGKASKVFASLQKTVNASNRGIGTLSKSMDKLGNKGDLKLNKELKQANGQMDRLVSKASKYARVLSTASTPKAGFTPPTPRGGMMRGNSSGGGMGLKGAAGLLGGIFALDQMRLFGGGVVETTATFQKFEAVLTNTFQSATRAKSAMAMIQDFASKTPFAVDELSGSFVKLANRGFAPTEDQMRKLGDLASSVGKDFDMLTEAMLDAEVFENERLKEFGIKGKDNKDGTMTYTFKGQDTTIKKDAKAIREYILSLGDMVGVQGSMAAISKTLGGRLSNLGDNFTKLQKVIGQNSTGAFTFFIDSGNKAIDFFIEFFTKISPLKQALSGIGSALSPVGAAISNAANQFSLFKGKGTAAEKTIALLTLGVKTITPPLRLVSNIIASTIGFISKYRTELGYTVATLGAVFAAHKALTFIQTITSMVKAGTVATKAASLATKGWAWAQNLLNKAFLTSPLGITIGVIFAVGGAILWAWNKFEGFRGGILGVWEVLKAFGAGVVDVFKNIPQTIENIFKGIASFFGKQIQPLFELINAVKQGNWLKAAKAGGKFLFNMSPAGVVINGTKAAGQAIKEKTAPHFKRGQEKAKNGGGTIDWSGLMGNFTLPDFSKMAGSTASSSDYYGSEESGGAGIGGSGSEAEKEARVKDYRREGSKTGGLEINVENLFSIKTETLLRSLGNDGLAIRDILTKELLAVVKDVSVSYGS